MAENLTLVAVLQIDERYSRNLENGRPPFQLGAFQPSNLVVLLARPGESDEHIAGLYFAIPIAQHLAARLVCGKRGSALWKAIGRTPKGEAQVGERHLVIEVLCRGAFRKGFRTLVHPCGRKGAPEKRNKPLRAKDDDF